MGPRRRHPCWADALLLLLLRAAVDAAVVTRHTDASSSEAQVKPLGLLSRLARPEPASALQPPPQRSRALRRAAAARAEARRAPPPLASDASRKGEQDSPAGTLVLLRHGESTWNAENRFTGWADVPLTERGVEDAVRAGRALRQEEGLQLDRCFTSVLRRAVDTTTEVLRVYGGDLPVEKSWRLNERHYGALTGLNKREAMQSEDINQADLKEWRSTMAGRPPPMDPQHAFYTPADPLYAGLDQVPVTESMLDACARVTPFWNETLRPALLRGENLLVISHANCMRALVRCIQNLSDEEMRPLGLPNAIPLVYHFAPNGSLLHPIDGNVYVSPLMGHYIGEDAAVFKQLDRDGSGTINAVELLAAGVCSPVESAVGNFDVPVCEVLLDAMDNDNDGEVNFKEFAAWKNDGGAFVYVDEDDEIDGDAFSLDRFR